MHGGYDVVISEGNGDFVSFWHQGNLTARLNQIGLIGEVGSVDKTV